TKMTNTTNAIAAINAASSPPDIEWLLSPFTYIKNSISLHFLQIKDCIFKKIIRFQQEIIKKQSNFIRNCLV
ncbi:hypothetical protein, partial [Enterococcus innesii]|uniref:hypothetical protein n=1 Tax=Enterococcus innesii TaxID=2839759 RepID=UPI003F84D3E8